MEDVAKAKVFTVRLYSGKYVQINRLTKADICIEDIAHTLAFKPRFNGNGKSWYSIAAHSIAVSHIVPPHLKLSALLHDASEGYLFDIPKPNKELKEFKDIVELENSIQELVYDKYFIPVEQRMTSEIKMADFCELNREWSLCMMSDKLSSNPKDDEREFIRLFYMYSRYMEKKVITDGTFSRHGRVEKIDEEIFRLAKIHNITEDEIHFSTN